jgi:DNA helicase HerA-like ATPase
MLIVIDEAHNLCVPNPVTPLETALTERISQIAAEGRKYGMWLLLSSQRPSKIHPNVISQCDNLALMKVSSSRDLAELTDVFGYVSPELIARSPGFGLGEKVCSRADSSPRPRSSVWGRASHVRAVRTSKSRCGRTACRASLATA